MAENTQNLNMQLVGTTPQDKAMSVVDWRTNLNGVTNSSLKKIDDAVGASPSTLATTAKSIVPAINELDGDKYDEVVENTGAGTLTFKANGVDKKTVQTGNPNQVTLDTQKKGNFNFVSTPLPFNPTAEYGLKVDLDAGTFTRLGNAAGASLDDFYNFRPWANMKRMVIEGQHMVYIPKFYYKRVATKTEPVPVTADANEIGKQLVVWEDWISPSPLEGYAVHPAFVRGGIAVDAIYFSAFEGSIYDTSASAYLLEDEQVADFNTDLLCSIPNAKPCSGKTQNLTLENARKLANNRNANSNYKWMQQDFTSVSAVQMLMVISMGNYDCQTTIGQGVVNIPDVPNTDNNSLKTGETLSMGIRCGFLGENGKSSVNFFGIENFWGNIWKFVDGINIQGDNLNQGWFSNDDLTVNTSTNKYNLGFTISKKNGMLSKVGYDENVDFAFMDSETARTNIISKDYFYQNNTYKGFLVARLGGSWNHGSNAGCFCWDAYYSAAFRLRNIGARLCCILK